MLERYNRRVCTGSFWWWTAFGFPSIGRTRSWLKNEHVRRRECLGHVFSLPNPILLCFISCHANFSEDSQISVSLSGSSAHIAVCQQVSLRKRTGKKHPLMGLHLTVLQANPFLMGLFCHKKMMNRTQMQVSSEANKTLNWVSRNSRHKRVGQKPEGNQTTCSEKIYLICFSAEFYFKLLSLLNCLVWFLWKLRNFVLQLAVLVFYYIAYSSNIMDL